MRRNARLNCSGEALDEEQFVEAEGQGLLCLQRSISEKGQLLRSGFAGGALSGSHYRDECSVRREHGIASKSLLAARSLLVNCAVQQESTMRAE